MNLKHPTTKIPHQETQTPPQFQSIKLPSFPNGKTHHHPPPPSSPSQTAVAYRECLKNHAVGIGGYAVDGCGEFMPSPTYATKEPSSFKCAACGCHRSFHRREPTTATPIRTHFVDVHRSHQTSTSTSLSPASPPPEPTNYAVEQHLVLSLKTGSDQNHAVATPGTPVAIKISGRKRFRTKFSQDQKEKMSIFAEKVGWKMQRCDDKTVAHFCNEIGIRRKIFKVWMHNNKNTLAKTEKFNTGATTTAVTTTVTATGLERSNDGPHQENGSSSSS
ncbi:hypothetical protein R6Q57_030178 [Mikania cordata]